MFVFAACGGGSDAAPAQEAPAEASGAQEAAPAPSADGGCPAVTVADPMGVSLGDNLRQYELSEFQELAGCELSFSENPSIADLNALITGNPELPAVANRLPAEPLVVAPFDQIGVYGGVLNGLSNATEAGTSDLLSVRHVNMVRYGHDFQTIVPNIAKGWEWNDDFTELTFFLREGHKWSDGAPFTANDVVFWANDLILNPEVYPEAPGWVTFTSVEAPDDTTVKFTFAAPAPGILSFLATTYIQPFQPQHFFEMKMEESGMSLAEVAEIYYGGSDWKDVPSPLLSGTAEDVLPTLESHILVVESTEGRRLVANPYFHMVDTAGNQLPYINEIDELYIPDKEVRNLKITNGEVDYKVQSIFIDDFPLYKENEGNGAYAVSLGNAVGETVFYGFNLNHLDEGLREIFGDLRFRQAMSLALDRAEIVEIIYLGQATPIQATPADPNTVDFVTEAHKSAFIDHDPDAANALLDEMGLLDVDGDGFRERPDGSSLTVQLQYANQGGPVKLHELTKSYWEAVGIRAQLKEVTSDEYRDAANSNQHDLATWLFDSTAGAYIVIGSEMLLPPFGEPFNPGIAYLWEEWVKTDGASGLEPPADVLELYDRVAEFQTKVLGSPESSAAGERIVDIHVDNLWKIGTAGEIKAPIIHHNNLGNFGPYSVVSYDYYRAYPMTPQQWFLSE
ncbi:MAG: ABC transporter substrate-binding protein [Caldilineaceae bacterium]|nr:ABC transporter substrate-binding protein [Caldilineaceae bacterium]